MLTLNTVENANSGLTTIYDVTVDSYSNVVVAGEIRGSAIIAGDSVRSKYYHDPVLAKWDQYGNGLYAVTLSCGGSINYNSPTGISAGPNGNVFITGPFAQFIEYNGKKVNAHGGNTDFYLAKFGIEQCEDTTTIDTTIGIRENLVQQMALNVFPNPNNGQFTIELNGAVNGQISVYNTLGSLVYKTEVYGRDKIWVNLPESLTNGVYMIHVAYNNTLKTSRVILRKD
ncbi:MAG: T9SS type A sorting domain-containing protein [Vicingaceae bacterium]